MRIVQRLRQSGHTAYFVGGCIRDLLLGRQPKDFDIVTSALPAEIRRLFRNSRIIGRRFLLVHVVFGNKIIEVATFRRAPEYVANSLLLKRDNAFGTDEQDVLRRDFTINALFYEPHENCIIDYVGGIEDLRAGRICTIGNPAVRFQEDPIRMLRAIKFSAQLNFEMAPEVRQGIVQHASLLAQASSERILLEILKILQSGASFNCLQQLSEHHVLPVIMPQIAEIWSGPAHPCRQLLWYSLQRLDKIPSKTRSQFSEATLMSVLCLPLLIHKARQAGRQPDENFCQQQLQPLNAKLHLSKGLIEMISRIISLQLYLEKARHNGNSRSMAKFLRKSYFRMALDLLYIRTYKDPATEEIYRFWEDNYRNGGIRPPKSL